MSQTKNYWLLKSEPAVWSWDDQQRAGTTPWDGVRNYQAALNMRAMKKGDQAFFYHSSDGKEIVGIVAIVQAFYSNPKEPADSKFGLVDVKAVRKLKQPVTLAQIKQTPFLSAMALVRQSRLSVTPVTAGEWAVILEISETAP